ncbi:MAG: metallophosphoesterase family protein [Lachnospiraceae bacterium]|nr:hydrolase [Lachnospiraceae bacterium]MCR5337302.1 metallophosphoesterase family protein [Lachnospiraceae bacterium]
MNLYIADTHFGHANVIKHDKRPFADVQEMDKAMIDLWNRRVNISDDVYIIGDFAFKAEMDESWYLKQLRGRKHLVTGNHDMKLLKNEKAMSYFESVDKMMHVADQGNHIALCHYPMIEWYRSFHGTYLIYGHIHNKKGPTYEIMKNIDRALNAAACINNYMPVSFDELVENNRRFQQEDKPEG